MPSLETLSSLGFEERSLGCPGNFAGMSRTSGVLKKLVQKKVPAHFRSLAIAAVGNMEFLEHNRLQLQFLIPAVLPW